MNYFTIIRTVLEDSLKSWCKRSGIDGREAKQRLVDHLTSMSEAWYSGEVPDISYDDPFCRLAYLYAQVGANANLFELALRSDRGLSELVAAKLSTKGLRVGAFGGGPGTELLGLAKHVHKTGQEHQSFSIEFCVFDRVREWADSWDSLARQIREDTSLQEDGKSIIIDKTFLPLDLTDVRCFENYDNLLRQDMYVFNYVISELIDDASKLQQVIELLVNSAESGAKFVIIDRNQGKFVRYAQEILSAAKLSVGKTRESATKLDLENQKSALEDYIKWMGRAPRTTWNSFWVVGTKE